MVGFGRVEEEYLALKSRVSELESRHSVIDQDRSRLYAKSQTHTTHSRTSVNVLVEDPQVEVLRRELQALVAENRGLVHSIRNFRVSYS